MPVSNRLPVTYMLIGINVLISMFAFYSPAFFEAMLFQVGPVRDGEIYRLLTAGFLHADLMHLLFNMFTLFFFGPVLESDRLMGRARFLIIYFAALLAGNLWALFAKFNEPFYAAVGASGAISGVMIAVSLFVPFMMIFFFGIIPVPAILFAVLYIGYSAFAMGSANSTIGHEAHLGGAIAGLVLTLVMFPGVPGHLVRQFRQKFFRR